ncbi:vegetative cell wall protein gp1, partial [Zea mays]|uniref:vegetative cell wall protein gp1 n=1 Tax=Zea mays TaxID=4577 RepID=UPI000C6C5323
MPAPSPSLRCSRPGGSTAFTVPPPNHTFARGASAPALVRRHGRRIIPAPPSPIPSGHPATPRVAHTPRIRSPVPSPPTIPPPTRAAHTSPSLLSIPPPPAVVCCPAHLRSSTRPMAAAASSALHAVGVVASAKPRSVAPVVARRRSVHMDPQHDVARYPSPAHASTRLPRRTHAGSGGA